MATAFKESFLERIVEVHWGGGPVIAVEFCLEFAGQFESGSDVIPTFTYTYSGDILTGDVFAAQDVITDPPTVPTDRTLTWSWQPYYNNQDMDVTFHEEIVDTGLYGLATTHPSQVSHYGTDPFPYIPIFISWDGSDYPAGDGSHFPFDMTDVTPPTGSDQMYNWLGNVATMIYGPPVFPNVYGVGPYLITILSSHIIDYPWVFFHTFNSSVTFIDVTKAKAELDSNTLSFQINIPNSTPHGPNQLRWEARVSTWKTIPRARTPFPQRNEFPRDATATPVDPTPSGGVNPTMSDLRYHRCIDMASVPNAPVSLKKVELPIGQVGNEPDYTVTVTINLTTLAVTMVCVPEPIPD